LGRSDLSELESFKIRYNKKKKKTDPLKEKVRGPLLYLKMASGTFNQYHIMWPVFVFARELHASVLIGYARTRSSFLDSLPVYEPIDQHLLWDLDYLRYYWKKRGVSVYFVSLEDLDARDDETISDNTNEVTTRRNSTYYDERIEEALSRLYDVRGPLNTREKVLRPGFHKPIKRMIEAEIESDLLEDMALILPAEYTYGGFAVNTLRRKRIAQEASMSIHISPEMMSLGCEVWSWIEKQVAKRAAKKPLKDGRREVSYVTPSSSHHLFLCDSIRSKVTVGMHMRLENDAKDWWLDTDLEGRLQTYSNAIGNMTLEGTISPASEHRMFGVLAFGELPPDVEEVVIEWADDLFGEGGWTTKKGFFESQSGLEHSQSSLPNDVIALVDAYLLTKCDYFVGYSYSSFSFTIQEWRYYLNRPTYLVLNNNTSPPPLIDIWNDA